MTYSKIGALFPEDQDPTRRLEEVQKVGATKEAKRDVEEFYETSSAQNVLSRLEDTITRSSKSNQSRFLYLHATFGSGKTHLLKLIGFVTEQAGLRSKQAEYVRQRLCERFDSFRAVHEAMKATADAFVPVFLNLLNRDASRRPPLPLLVFEAIGQRLGYPAEPGWVSAFLMRCELDSGRDDFYEVLRRYTVDENTLKEVCNKDRGAVRSWFKVAIPEVDESFKNKDILERIRESEKRVQDNAFNAEELSKSVKDAQTLFAQRLSVDDVELVLGLDEIALFIGNEHSRYVELATMIEALKNSTNPVVLGTGQWGVTSIHEKFEGSPDPSAWYAQEVQLKGTDTEVIVRKRWLRKQESTTTELEDVLAPMRGITPAAIPDRATSPEAVEAYPFREGDLRRIRQIMQGLITKGRTDRTSEPIQGRALLVLVRALFVRQEWATKPVGRLVSYNHLYDLIRLETSLIPTWVDDLIEAIDSGELAETDRAVDVAKTVYLINRITHEAATPATERVIAYLLRDRVSANYENLRHSVQVALKALVTHNRLRKETSKNQPVYRLLSEQEVQLNEEIERYKTQQLRERQVRSRVQKWLEEKTDDVLKDLTTGRIFTPEGRKGKAIPVSAHCNIQTPKLRGLNPEGGKLVIRVLVYTKTDLNEHVDEWHDQYARRGPLQGEDLLVAVQLLDTYAERFKDYMATEKVLLDKSENFEDARRKQKVLEKALRDQLRTAVSKASLYTPTSRDSAGFFRDAIVPLIERRASERFPNRLELDTVVESKSDTQQLELFFQGDSNAWPLSRRDAETLGIDLKNTSVSLDSNQNGWLGTFMNKAKNNLGRGTVPGENVRAMVEQGYFAGTPHDALRTALVVLAVARQIQVRKDGEIIYEPDAIRKAVKNVTSLGNHGIRFEPAPNQDGIQSIVNLVELLAPNENTTDPSDVIALIEALAQTARNYEERAQIQTFVTQNFDDVGLKELYEALDAVAANVNSVSRRQDNFALISKELTSEPVHQQAQWYYHARRLREHPEIWHAFTNTRIELRERDPMSTLNQAMQTCTQGSVPKIDRLQQLIEKARTYLNQLSGTANEDELPSSYDMETPSQESLPEPGAFSNTRSANEAANERFDELVKRLNNDFAGRIVRIDTSG